MQSEKHLWKPEHPRLEWSTCGAVSVNRSAAIIMCYNISWNTTEELVWEYSCTTAGMVLRSICKILVEDLWRYWEVLVKVFVEELWKYWDIYFRISKWITNVPFLYKFILFCIKLSFFGTRYLYVVLQKHNFVQESIIFCKKSPDLRGVIKK